MTTTSLAVPNSCPRLFTTSSRRTIPRLHHTDTPVLDAGPLLRPTRARSVKRPSAEIKGPTIGILLVRMRPTSKSPLRAETGPL